MPAVSSEHSPTTTPNPVPSRVRIGTSRNIALVGLAFFSLTLFALLQIRSLTIFQNPEARLATLLPSIGAEILQIPFDAAIHDRELETPPWSKNLPPKVTLRGLQKHVVFLNFWATWCEPCIRELPSMVALLKRQQGRDFTMIAVSYDESWDDVKRFFDTATGGIPEGLIVLRDPAMADDPLRARYGTEKLPESYVIRDGLIEHRFVNAHNWVDSAKVEYFNLMLAENP
ncbi:MAG: TlpA family protein disulfide reductase [Myxococcales bacterium]|nr:TlpA family protein disulfide reductase [Myxococcales bacterium]